MQEVQLRLEMKWREEKMKRVWKDMEMIEKMEYAVSEVCKVKKGGTERYRDKGKSEY